MRKFLLMVASVVFVSVAFTSKLVANDIQYCKVTKVENNLHLVAECAAGKFSALKNGEKVKFSDNCECIDTNTINVLIADDGNTEVELVLKK